MDKEKLGLETRLIALEYLVAHIYNLQLVQLGATEAQIEASEKSGEAVMQTATVPKAGAAMSDHMTAEILEDTRRLWLIAREMRAGL